MASTPRAYSLQKYWPTCSPEQAQANYDRMFTEQVGCCDICGRNQTEFKKALHVDHCHESERVRGLLCLQCNAALGYIKDNIKTAKNMVKYLQKHKED